MDVRNCRLCGKIFNYIGGEPLCPTCIKKMDDKFAEVKEFIYNNPGVGVQEVSESMEVPIPVIKKWVREERLCFSDDSIVGIECESCGETIKTGRFCPKCKDKMTNTLESAYRSAPSTPEKEKQPADKAKIRFNK